MAPDPAAHPTDYAEIAFSHPRWVVDEFRRALGAEELFALLRADNEPPLVTLVARPGRSTPGRAARQADAVLPDGVVLAGGDPAPAPAVAEGRAGVQDEGSQLVALAAGGAPVDGTDRRWLDLCAGPGGKAALLAALAAERGAGLLAIELQQHRARLVARTLAGADGVRGVVTADGAAPRWPRAPSTGSWSTRPAPASAPCDDGPSPAGGVVPRT